jgi:hypothetical protein
MPQVRPGTPMRTETMANWMSTSKVVAVVAIAKLVEQRKINVNDYVAKHLPKFGKYGKELITIEHLLVHTGGIPYADVALWSAMHEWTRVLDVIYEAKIVRRVPTCAAACKRRRRVPRAACVPRARCGAATPRLVCTHVSDARVCLAPPTCFGGRRRGWSPVQRRRTIRTRLGSCLASWCA